ncbi:hypothetical protein L1987_05921 [Smallanthus sonchifolius]|uniref:Uncharacterized protein n=1 Tax=Smallanthus sonchifolius TaxID=185202 RepID=A0ACB9JWN8_9ASTR|nr:hypothetical protein L1987_05921 [Smallanthus sonchifolius]
MARATTPTRATRISSGNTGLQVPKRRRTTPIGPKIAAEYPRVHYRVWAAGFDAAMRKKQSSTINRIPDIIWEVLRISS